MRWSSLTFILLLTNCSSKGLDTPIGRFGQPENRPEEDQGTLSEGTPFDPAKWESSQLVEPNRDFNVEVGPDVAKLEEFSVDAKVVGAVAYLWTVEKGDPANITFSDPKAPATKIVGKATGQYLIRLNIQNSTGFRTYDEFNLTWGGDHFLFTTSAVYDGNLGGLTGADAKCMERAKAAGLKGDYKALLSTSTVHAKDRINIRGKVFRIDGALLANNAADLWDGNLNNTLTVDEAGAPTVANLNQTPWTGSTPTGLLNSERGNTTCGDWTNISGNTYLGLAYYKDSYWMYYPTTIYSCREPNSVYCLSAEPGVVPY